MGAWLNTPSEIIESDHDLVYWLSAWINSPEEKWTYSYQKTRWTTTRYVGCDYNGAIAKRDELELAYPGIVHAGSNTSTIEVRVEPAGGGQYHVVATLKTVGPWVEYVPEP